MRNFCTCATASFEYSCRENANITWIIVWMSVGDCIEFYPIWKWILLYRRTVHHMHVIDVVLCCWKCARTRTHNALFQASLSYSCAKAQIRLKIGFRLSHVRDFIRNILLWYVVWPFPRVVCRTYMCVWQHLFHDEIVVDFTCQFAALIVAFRFLVVFDLEIFQIAFASLASIAA